MAKHCQPDEDEREGENGFDQRVFDGDAAAAIVAAAAEQKPPYDRNVVVPADRVVALGATRAGQDEAFAGAEAVPDDGEEAADAAAEAGEPEDGEPPEDVGEQAVAGLELDGGEGGPMMHVESLRDSARMCNGRCGCDCRVDDSRSADVNGGLRMSALRRIVLDDAVQRAAGGGEGVDAARDFGVFDERRGVVRFEAGVDHERAAAAPMFVLCEGVDAVDVGGGVGARERDPEEVAERFGDELGVVDDDDQAEAGDADVADCGLRIADWRSWS